MKAILCYLAALLVFNKVASQVTYTTVPNTDSGAAYVFADEGTLNVSIYCKVINSNTPAVTRWLIRRSNDSQLIVPTFDFNGKVTNPTDLVGKIEAIGDIFIQGSLTFQTNFTILNFTNEFDLSLVKCGPQTATLRQFNFGFPGTYSIKSENFILLYS